MLPVTPGKEPPPPYPLNMVLVWSRSHCRRFGVGKNLLPLLGIEPRFIRCPGISLGTIATALGTAEWGFSLRSSFSELHIGGGLLGHVTVWCGESMPAFRSNVVFTVFRWKPLLGWLPSNRIYDVITRKVTIY